MAEASAAEILRGCLECKETANITADKLKAFQKPMMRRKIQIFILSKGTPQFQMLTNYDKKTHDLLNNDTSYAVLRKDSTRSTEEIFCHSGQVWIRKEKLQKNFETNFIHQKG